MECSPPSQSKSPRPTEPPLLLYGAASVVGLLTLGSLPFLVIPMLRGNALPYMNIPMSKYKTIFDEVLPRHMPRRRAGSPPLRFIDLGHGMGEAVVNAAQRGYVATGVELNPTLYLLSICNVWRHGILWPLEPRVRLVYGNMWRKDMELGRQDVILMFGVQSLMTRLAERLRSEAQHDALVVLYRFKLDLRSRASPTGAALREITGRDGSDEQAEIKILEVTEDGFSVYRIKKK